MRFVNAGLGIAVVAMVALIANKAMMPRTEKVQTAAPEVSTMPVGVTLQTTGNGGPYGRDKGPTVVADSKGLTLYTFDKDTQPGKSACNAECAKAWTPLTAPADAKPSGFWSVATRDDGSKQWAFKGRPLYGSTQDTKPSETKGNGVDGVWHMALYQPAEGMPLPDGITVMEMTNAGGQVFVDARKKTLYVFAGDVKNDAPPCAPGQTCMDHWLPLTAPELANTVGDFAPVSRADGTKQWAYKGQGLYSYDGDIEVGEAAGKDADPKYRVALLERYFIPANAAVKRNLQGFDMLTTADGMTLYARDRYMYQVGGFSLKGGQKGIAAMGRAMGVLTCPAECVKAWPPLKAPDDAKPSGYWTVVSRPDGSKQWAYGGYPLYTFTGDGKPGDARGHDSFDISIKLPPTPSPIDAVSGLYWREVTP